MSTKFKFKPVTHKNLDDLENLFESKGGPSYCWCMVWRNMKEGGDRNSRPDKKSSLNQYVKDKQPIGILAYDDSTPIAWCSIAPRETYRDFGGDQDLKDVWSLACFYIKKEYRKQSLSETLAKEAIKYAKKKGAKHVEAYPVDPDSPSYRFMDFRTLFEKLGFKETGKAGNRRFVAIMQV